MREEALTPRRRRRFLATTDSTHAHPIFANLLSQVRPTGPNQVWVADLTYIRLRTEFAYLAVILDAWSRKVVGYAVSHLLDVRLSLAALDAALESRRPPPGLIHRSYRGVQYASQLYRDRLADHQIRGSMSRTGNPYDNAQVESFLKTLKHEEVYVHEYDTMQDVIDRLPCFLEEVYNRRRLHSALGYRPPEEYEALFTRSAAWDNLMAPICPTSGGHSTILCNLHSPITHARPSVPFVPLHTSAGTSHPADVRLRTSGVPLQTTFVNRQTGLVGQQTSFGNGPFTGSSFR